MTTNKLALAATAGAITNVAGAAILTSDFSSPLVTGSTSQNIYIDFANVNASTVFTSSSDGQVFFNAGNFEKPKVSVANGWNIFATGVYAPKFAPGDTFAGALSGGQQYLEKSGAGPWASPNDGLGAVFKMKVQSFSQTKMQARESMAAKVA